MKPINTFLATMLFCTLAIAPLRSQAIETVDETTNVLNTNAPAQPALGHSADMPTPDTQLNGPGLQVGGRRYEWGGDIKQIIAVLIPIVAIIMGCSIPIAIIGMKLYFRHRKNIMLHETLRTMVEKGTPIPPELLQKSDREAGDENRPGFVSDQIKRPRNDMRIGLMFIGIGIGLVMLTGKAGYIILFMGVAFVISALVEKKNNPPTGAPGIADQLPKP